MGSAHLWVGLPVVCLRSGNYECSLLLPVPLQGFRLGKALSGGGSPAVGGCVLPPEVSETPADGKSFLSQGVLREFYVVPGGEHLRDVSPLLYGTLCVAF